MQPSTVNWDVWPSAWGWQSKMLSAPNRKTYRARPALLALLPEKVREMATHTGSYQTAFTRSERRALRKKKLEKPSEWAPKNRKITKGDLAGHFMSFDVSPHLRGIMDAAVLPFVREIGIMAAAQTGKTTCIDTLLGWTRVFAKGPACSFYPDETTAKRSMKSRIQPMVKQSPAMRRNVIKGKDSYSLTGIDMIGGEWEVGWVGSVAQTADRSIKYVDMQEVDKPSYGVSRDETAPMYLLRKRVRSYGDTGKVFISSTPTTVEGNINQYIEHECQAVFVQWVRCPYCHEEVLMRFSEQTFFWPKGPDGHHIDRRLIFSKKLARYVCQHCQARWTDDDRDKAIRRETWRLRILDENGELTEEKGEEMFRYLHRHRPATIGFIMPSWYSYFVSLSEVASDFLRSIDPNLSPEERFASLKDFRNGHEARPWKIEAQTTPVSQLRKFCDQRPEGLLPGGEVVAGFFGTVDTQDAGDFYVSLWAFGYGYDAHQWLVKRKHVFGFTEIVRMMWQSDYYDEDGQRYQIEHVFIDMLGHRAKEVIEFCMQYEGLITPVFGSAHKMTQPYTFSQREYIPGTATKLPGGGIQAIRMNSKYYKDNLAVKLAEYPTEEHPERERRVHFYRHEELGDDYLKQLVAEERDPRTGDWQQINSRPNHYWDNWYAANCLADWFDVKNRPCPESRATSSHGGATKVVAEIDL